jgi:uncharacterized protein
MIRNAISGLVIAAALLMTGAATAADTPSLHQVYEAAQSGRLDEAQGMIEQVLKEHPNSAKAHFVDAEILAKAGHTAQAREQLAAAEQLEPGLPFAKPQAVQALRARVSSAPVGQQPVSAYPPAQAGFPWGMLVLLIGAIAVITLIMRAVTNRNAARPGYPSPYPSAPGAPGYGGQPYPGGGYAPMAPTAPGMGSGIMSSLATGAALGAGMVAGEALVHHFIDGDGNRVESGPSSAFADSGTSSDNMGGSDFGIADNSSWDDNSNMADISGGDDWS